MTIQEYVPSPFVKSSLKPNRPTSIIVLLLTDNRLVNPFTVDNLRFVIEQQGEGALPTQISNNLGCYLQGIEASPISVIKCIGKRRNRKVYKIDRDQLLTVARYVAKQYKVAKESV